MLLVVLAYDGDGLQEDFSVIVALATSMPLNLQARIEIEIEKSR